MKLKQLNKKNIDNELLEFRSGLQDNLRYTLESVELSMGVDSNWVLTVNNYNANNKNLDAFAEEEVDFEAREIEIVKNVLIENNRIIFNLDKLDVAIITDYKNTFSFDGKSHNDYDKWVNQVLDDLEGILTGTPDSIDLCIMDISMLLELILEGNEYKHMRYGIEEGMATVLDGLERVDAFVHGEQIKCLYRLDLKAVLADKIARNVDLLTYGFDFDRPVIKSRLENYVRFNPFELRIELNTKSIGFYLDNKHYLTLPYFKRVKSLEESILVITDEDVQGVMILDYLEEFAEQILRKLSVNIQIQNSVKKDIFNQLVEILNNRVVKQYYQWDNDRLRIR